MSLKVDLDEAFRASRTLIAAFGPPATTSAAGLFAVAVLACGMMVAKSIHQLDATLRQRGEHGRRGEEFKAALDSEP